jgi:Right handed beta helix region
MIARTNSTFSCDMAPPSIRLAVGSANAQPQPQQPCREGRGLPPLISVKRAALLVALVLAFPSTADALTVTNANGRVLDGGGRTIRFCRSDPHAAGIRLVGGSNVTIRNWTIVGCNTHGRYVPRVEWQHGIEVLGTQGVLIERVRIADVYGDGISLFHDRYSTPARGVHVRRVRIRNVGRQGIGIIDATGTRIGRTWISGTPWSAIDLEPDHPEGHADDVAVRRSRFSRMGRYAVESGHTDGPSFRGLRFTRNRVCGRYHGLRRTGGVFFWGNRRGVYRNGSCRRTGIRLPSFAL